MSFFGFDTTLPRDRAANASNDHDTFGSLGGDDLDEKIRGLTAGAQEDVEVRSCSPWSQDAARSDREQHR